MPNFIRLKQLNQTELSGFFTESISNISGSLVESAKVSASGVVLSQSVLTTGNQIVSGLKNFNTKPTVNNIPVVLTNELSAGQDLTTFVLRSGDQTVSGLKTFINNQTFSGNINVSGTGIFNAIDLNNIDNLNLSGVDIVISGGNVSLLTNNFTVRNKQVTDRSFGPYVLNRNTSILFDASNYLPSRDGVALSSLSLTASAGNINTPNTLGYYGMFNFLSTTAEGIFPGFVNPFNPFRVFGGGSQYRINAYVYATNISNDGLHCMLRSVTNDGNNNLTETTITWSNGAIEFGGGPGSSSRVYLGESQLITASSDQFINYKLYLGAYAGSNNGLVRDAVLYFYRDI